MQIAKRRRVRVVRSGVALAMLVGVVSCGDDGAATGSAEPTGACGQLVQFDSIAAGTDETTTATPEAAKAFGAQLAPLWQQALLAVPEAARADGEAVTKSLADLQKGDDEAFNADETFESYTKVLTAAVKACGFGTRAVSATQSGGKYAFTGVPKRLDAGVVAVTMTNKDAEPHVMVVLRKNDGEKRSVQELLALPDDGVMGAGTPAGATFAVPGAEAVGLLRLTAGNYLYFCPIPIGGTEGAPPHFTNGMYGEFTVG